jgi:copper chaperone CopZ
MKNLKIIVLCMLSLAFIMNVGCKNSTSNTNSNKEISIKLDFFCEHGKTIIEEGIAKEVGVLKVAADVKKQIVTVNYDSTKTNKDKLVAAFEKLGFNTEFSKTDTKVTKPCDDMKKEKCEEKK